ncbi:MAG TPA: winged helix-turn-helix domain-containing protein [Chthonomonadaceae bacterium]|nr:winged helix-turn-helix domain-containing protein [Chthonomonadaceae bacterium]
MASRHFQLTQEQANELQAAYLYCQDAATKTRYQAVRLYGVGYPVVQIMDITGASRTSLMDWCRLYRKKGLLGLVDHRVGGNSAKLSAEQIEAIQNQLHRYTPAQRLGQEFCVGDGQFWTIADLKRLVQQEYGVLYQSQNSYYNLLNKCGFSLQRPAKQYKSRSEDKGMAFEEALEKNS